MIAKLSRALLRHISPRDQTRADRRRARHESPTRPYDLGHGPSDDRAQGERRFRALLLIAVSVAGFFASTALSATDNSPLTLSFGARDYLHRWSKEDQHEFTPVGQEDLSSWEDMLILNVNHDVWDGDDLAAYANRVLSNYRAHGRIVTTDSVRRTRKRPAEHLIVAVFKTPEFLEAVFNRLLLFDDTGLSIAASHRIYGADSGDAMSAWLEQNGPARRETLMKWKSIPQLNSLGLNSLGAPATPHEKAVGLMGSLRAHLETVRLMPPPFKSRPRPLPDASILVGLSREDVENGLGAPSGCRPMGSPPQPPGCGQATHWTFSFFRLAPGTRGGGLQLAVEFSTEGLVESATFGRTQ